MNVVFRGLRSSSAIRLSLCPTFFGAGQGIHLPFRVNQIIVGEVAIVLFKLAFELVPRAFKAQFS